MKPPKGKLLTYRFYGSLDGQVVHAIGMGDAAQCTAQLLAHCKSHIAVLMPLLVKERAELGALIAAAEKRIQQKAQLKFGGTP